MQPILIAMTIHHRVEAEVNAVIRACMDAQNSKTRLCLLGPKGSMRYLQGTQVSQMANTDQYLKAAQGGFLYEERPDPVFAFAETVDPTSYMPVFLESYDDAFAKRSYAGKQPEPPANVEQVAMEVPAEPVQP